MRKTENFELNLIDAEEFVNVEDLNENAQKTDEILKEHDTPEYDVSEQEEVEELASGESLKIALRKLARAVADYISHKADVVAHITAAERTAWNAKLGADKIAANLTTTTEGMVLAAAMGKTLKEQIDKNATDISTLNSNKLSYGIATGTENVLYKAYGMAGISRTSGVKSLVIATDSDSMAYGVYIASYVHGSYLNLVNILNGGIQANSYNQLGTVSWIGQTGIPITFVIPIA